MHKNMNHRKYTKDKHIQNCCKHEEKKNVKVNRLILGWQVIEPTLD